MLSTPLSYASALPTTASSSSGVARLGPAAPRLPWRGLARASELCGPDLVEVLGCCPHLLPGLVQQLDADAKELLKRAVVGEEHRVVVVASLVRCARRSRQRMTLGAHVWKPGFLCSPEKQK